MFDLLLTMGLIVITWALMGAALVGIGAGVMRLARDAPTRPTDWPLAFWAGLAAATGALHLWHFAAPVNSAAYWSLIAVGALGLGWAGRGLPGMLWRAAKTAPAFVLVMLFVVGFAANNAILAPARYDTGLYQLQSFAWTNEYAVVPGLGNLHGRLAFNNSYHLVIAALNRAFPLAERGPHLANGLPLLSLVAWGLVALRRLVVERRTDAPTLYWVLTLPVVLRHTLHLSLYNPDNDLMVLLAGLVVIGVALAWLTDPTQVRRGRLVTLAALVAVGVTYKISFGVLGGGVLLVVLWASWRDNTLDVRTVGAAAGAALALGIPWLARSVWMSGYPLYPITAFPAPVDWLMIAASVEQEAQWVRAWARQPYITGSVGQYGAPDLTGFGWVVPWLFDTFTTTPNLFDVTLPTMITLGAVGWALAAGRVRSRGWWLLAPLALALGFWLAVAPSPRFAGAAFWGAAALTVALAGAAQPDAANLRGAAVALAVVCALLMPTQLRIVFPASDEAVFYNPPTPALDTHTTPYTSYFYPTESDQCWAAPLPCAPRYVQIEGLCMREPGNLAAGFSVADGPRNRCNEQLAGGSR